MVPYEAQSGPAHAPASAFAIVRRPSFVVRESCEQLDVDDGIYETIEECGVIAANNDIEERDDYTSDMMELPCADIGRNLYDTDNDESVHSASGSKDSSASNAGSSTPSSDRDGNEIAATSSSSDSNSGSEVEPTDLPASSATRNLSARQLLRCKQHPPPGSANATMLVPTAAPASIIANSRSCI